MIFHELQSESAELLNGDAYFSAAPGCPVFWQGQKEDSEGKPLKTAKAFQDALNGAGVAAMVLHPKITNVDGNFARAHLTVLIIENVFKNRGDGGTGKTAHEFAVKAMGILINSQLAPWSQFVFEDLDDNVQIEAEGLEGWALSVNCTTLLDTIFSDLADETGALIVTENNEPLEVSPTEP